jgi:hypothetical protein
MLDLALVAGPATVPLLTAQAVTATDVQTWAQTAAEYGPFFFSLLFLGVLPWQIGKRMSKASGDAERRVWRRLLCWTFAFGLALVAFSVYWWGSHQPSFHLLRGKIEDLASYEQVAGNDFYFRSEWKGPPIGNTRDLRRDVHFLVLQEKPFEEGQLFPLDFAKGPSSPKTRFEITVEPSDAEGRYEIKWNESAQRNELTRLAEGPASWPTSLFAAVALAQSRPAAAAAPQGPIADARPELALLLQRLQDERTDVGTKIDAIDRILAAGPAVVREILASRTDKEAALLTFSDLSRHSDPELASKARKVLELGNAEKLLSDRLIANARRERADAESVLARLPDAEAAAVVQEVRARSPHRAESLETSMKNKSTESLRPTGSAQGDRYYVKASWDPGEPGVVQCLTELFNRRLITRRTLEEEARLMEGRSSRIVFWYSKDWALEMADLIRGCGAEAEFVRP